MGKEEYIYNYDNKRWYIETVSNHALTIRNMENMFSKAKSQEEMLGKDLCDWNLREIIRFMKNLGTSSRSMINNHVSLYKKYTDFCLYHKMVDDCINHYDEITEIMIDDSTNRAKLQQEIIKRDDLLKLIEPLDNYADKFFVLAIYEGIKGINWQELRGLSTNDIDGNKIKLPTGRIIDISNELRNFAFLAAEETERMAFNSAEKEWSLSLNMEDPTIIIKPRGGRTTIKQGAFLRRLKQIAEFVGYEKITPKKILYSGALYYIEKECKKYNVTAKQFFESPELRANFENQYSEFNIANKRELLNRYEEYLKL